MGSDWNEIQRLASDFQKVQLSSTLQRLSDQNCIEVVSLLIKNRLLNVVFTSDGKEYITPKYLRKEIEDEIVVHGGRVNLVELSQILNVDLSHINGIAERVSKERYDLHLVLGQLLDENYLLKIAIEINEKLAQEGEISVSDLTIQFDLPSEFLLVEVMEKYLNKVIRGRQDISDPRIFFTPNYISRCKAKIRGALIGLKQPTSSQNIIQQIGVQERIFFTLFNEVNPAGILTSKQHSSQYIPHIYTKNQREWVESFYKQNSYLEYDAVSRLGVSDSKKFIQRCIGSDSIVFLSKCCVDQRILDQIESAVDECISSGSHLDVGTILPSSMVSEDIKSITTIVLTAAKQKQTFLFSSTIITTRYIENLLKPCYDLVEKKAKLFVDSGMYQKYIADKALGMNKNVNNETSDRKLDRKDERRRKANVGKGGGGVQGRETKMKSTKKLYRAADHAHRSESDDEIISNNKKNTGPTINIITLTEVVDIIKEHLEDEGLDELSEIIAAKFYPTLTKTSLESAYKYYESSLQNSSQEQRQAYSALQDKLNEALHKIRLCDKGLRLLPLDIQIPLTKYLLKSHATDICNEIFFYVANLCNLNYAVTSFKAEQRTKIVQNCGDEYKLSLAALNRAISGTSTEEFLSAAENASVACGMILKKTDKRRDRNIVLCHKHALLEELNSSDDPAMTLHIVVLIIFLISTQCMVHASGKFVSPILSFIQPLLSPEQSSALAQYHGLVLKLLTASPNFVEIKTISEELQNKMENIKAIARTYKKPGTTGVE